MGGILGGMALISYFNQPEIVDNVKIEKEVTEVEVTPDWATDEDAVKAAQDVIRKKELEAKEAEYVESITQLQAELDEVRKELGSY